MHGPVGLQHQPLSIKKLDNGGFLVNVTIMKEKHKEGESMWEDRSYAYSNKKELIAALDKDFFGDDKSEMKHKDMLST